MILVDSCVWIDLLRGKKTPAVLRLEQIRRDKNPEICVSSIVYFEVLRGISADFERRKVQKAFDLLEKRDYRQGGFDHLVRLSHLAEAKGISVKKLGDWLIVKTVMDHSLSLLTSDGDFVRLSRVLPLVLERLEE